MKFMLVMFGWFAIITSVLLILVPYLLRRGDLISGWTVYQVGCANFLGMSAIQSGSALSHQYVTPMPEDYSRFVLGGAVFYVVSILTYYYFRLPGRLGDVTLRKTGPRAPNVLLCLLPVCIGLSLGFLFVPQVQFLGQWLVMLGRGAGIIGLAFCLVIWAQRPFNLTSVLLICAAALFALIGAASQFGRRDFLAVVMTIPICWYWLRTRHANPGRVLAIGSVYLVIASFAIIGASIARGMRANPDLNMVQAGWERIKALPEVFSNPRDIGILGGDSTEASLAAIRLYSSIQQPQPFHTLKYIAVHWIPRAWWPEKPSGLGMSLSWDTGYNRAHGSSANIGPGIVGHGYYEGGLLFVAFYAWLFASVLRWFDAMLARDPSNPYLLGAFCASSGQLVAFARGDIALFSVIIIGTWIAAMILNYLGRIFFWTDYVPSTLQTQQIATTEHEYTWTEPTPQPQLDAWRI